MNRDAAIEAGKRALWAADPTNGPWDEADRGWKAHLHHDVTTVIDAALPHLVGEPVGYAVVDAAAEWISTGHRVWSAHEVRGVVARLDDDGEEGHRVVALIPLEDTP